MSNQPAPAYVNPDARPGTVTVAGIVTIVLCVLSTIFGFFLLAFGLADSGTISVDSDAPFDLAGRSYAELKQLILVAGIVVLVWSVVAIVTAVATLRRSRVARIVLVALAVLTVVVDLGFTRDPADISSFPVLGAFVVVVLLFTGGANDWFARRERVTTS